jgi:SAM-dependent methyltransferase
MPDLNALIPPGELQFVGTGDFLAIGREFLGLFRSVGGLQAHHRVLDIGCGNGRMALPLMEFLSSEGSYEGFDIVREGIDWCAAHMTAADPRFRFRHLDVFNAAYNLHGKVEGYDCTFPYPDAEFNFAFLTSVFTHLLPQDMENYVHEIARVLKWGGQCFVTCYLRNREAERLIDAGKARLAFPSRGKGFTYEGASPEEAICFPEAYFLDLFARFGMEPVGIHHGNWSGREKFLSMQDVVVFRRRAGVTLQKPEVPAKVRLSRLWRRVRTRIKALAFKTFMRREYGWKLHAETYMNIKKAERLASSRK